MDRDAQQRDAPQHGAREHDAREYDAEYIVVGSGAGGGPVAANLAAAGHSVLLLEAGEAPETLNYQVPAFHPGASEEPDMSWEMFVRHYENDEQQRRDSKFVASEDGIFYPRAGTLGGCTAHHAMIFLYPSNSDWDHIAKVTGDPSWKSGKMRRYFMRLERCRYRRIWRVLDWLTHFLPLLNITRHGFRGWLTTEEADPKMLLEDKDMLRLIERAVLSHLIRSSRSWWEALRRALTFFFTAGDPNTWTTVKHGTEGLRFTPLTTDDGARIGSRERIRQVQEHPKHGKNLEVRMGALVSRVLFDHDDPTRAVGVEYLEGQHLYRADPAAKPGNEGVVRQARASREVILCGGAFNTPQLLQLSGIGPAELLQCRDIPVRLDRPGVGANLQDRYEVGVVQKMKKPFKMTLDATMRPPEPGEPPDPPLQEWIDRRSGVYTTNGALASFIKRSDPSQPDPDLFVFGLVTDFRGYEPGYSKRIQASKDHFTWAVLKAHTNNTAGRVAIRSRDPRETPDINFHYFQEGNDTREEDLEAVVKGVQLVRDLGESYQHMVEEEVWPGPDVCSPSEIAEWVRNEAWGHHASCTCKIGADDDEMAVLDSDFRVRGTRGLRVVDASVFPRIPGLFVLSAIYMVAEKASDVILADAKTGAAS